MKQRTKKVAAGLAIIVVIGYLYGIFVKDTGLAVPCVFYSITGLKCPGCGVTTMCISIMRLDFAYAYFSNQMLFILLPVLALLFGSYVLRYIKTGCWTLSKKQTVLVYVCIGLLILFAVYRNIHDIYFL